MIEKTLTYRDWIRQFKADDSPFGELAREIWTHSAPAGVFDYYQWRVYLNNTGCEALDILKESFKRYLFNEEPNLPTAQVTLAFENAHGVSEDLPYSLKGLTTEEASSGKPVKVFTLFGFQPQFQRKLEALKRQSTFINFTVEHIDSDETEQFAGTISDVIIDVVARQKVIRVLISENQSV